MNSLVLLKHHFSLFHFFGAWLRETDSPLSRISYNSKTIFVFLFIGITFPLSQISCMFFMTTLNQVVECLIILSSVVVVILKAVNLYIQQKKMLELLKSIKETEKEIVLSSHQDKFIGIFRSCRRIFNGYMISYMFIIFSLVLQSFFSSRDKRSWSSTYIFPYEFAQKLEVYFSVLVYQGLSNVFVCLFAVAADTYGVVFTQILAGHVDVLGARLSRLGERKNTRSVELYKEIIECCKSYIIILR